MDSAAPNQISEDSSVDHNQDSPHSHIPNHGGVESAPIFSTEEVRSTLETSASTGKFCISRAYELRKTPAHNICKELLKPCFELDWEKLRSVLSYYLKQVLSEYPEAQMTNEQQISSLGETFQELVKRLDDALHSFDEGPPFTLQRLCEILLTARSIYPKLSKVSLALEKNLLVTSTLTISTDPYPFTTKQNSNGSYEGSDHAKPQTSSVENGVEFPVADKDEVMADVQEAEVGEDLTTTKMETIEDVGGSSSEASPSPMVDS